MICSIFACDANGGIGKNGTLPWEKDPEDFRWFRSNTTNHIVVMGKNTWMDPLFPKPLPKRENIVVTSNPYGCENAHKTIDGTQLDQHLISLRDKNPDKTVWIIGGSQLLLSTAHLIQKVYLTKFDQTYECDVKMNLNIYLRNFKMIEDIPAAGKRFQVYDAKLS